MRLSFETTVAFLVRLSPKPGTGTGCTCRVLAPGIVMGRNEQVWNLGLRRADAGYDFMMFKFFCGVGRVLSVWDGRAWLENLVGCVRKK